MGEKKKNTDGNSGTVDTKSSVDYMLLKLFIENLFSKQSLTEDPV
jgi:hypothetical protein